MSATRRRKMPPACPRCPYRPLCVEDKVAHLMVYHGMTEREAEGWIWRPNEGGSVWDAIVRLLASSYVPMTVKEIADNVGCSPAYASKLLNSGRARSAGVKARRRFHEATEWSLP